MIHSIEAGLLSPKSVSFLLCDSLSADIPPSIADILLNKPLCIPLLAFVESVYIENSGEIRPLFGISTYNR